MVHIKKKYICQSFHVNKSKTALIYNKNFCRICSFNNCNKISTDKIIKNKAVRRNMVVINILSDIQEIMLEKVTEIINEI